MQKIYLLERINEENLLCFLYLTKNPFIDFPLTMNYRAEEQESSRAEVRAIQELSISSTNASRIPNTPYRNYQSNNTENYFYFLNGHNDVAYFSNSTFDDFETYEYNPWGVLLTQANKNNLLYTSREFDFDIAFQFNRMRYYLLNLGRFSQKDLIYMKASNAFAYASDNPINFLDPFGLYNRGGMIPGISLGPGYGGGGGSYYCETTTSSCKSPCMYCCIYDENGNLAGYVTTCQCDYLIYCDEHR